MIRKEEIQQAADNAQYLSCSNKEIFTMGAQWAMDRMEENRLKSFVQIPDGKKAEWVNGVLTLVDEPQVDNRPVTERVKTFEDACNVLGDEHPLVKEYWGVANIEFDIELDIAQDLIAYLKLRIIVAALNEGWEPQFVRDECRYYPWFWLYTQEEYDNMDEKGRRCCAPFSGNNTNANSGFVYVNASHVASLSNTFIGSQLAFKSKALAEYAAQQFADIWMAFYTGK